MREKILIDALEKIKGSTMSTTVLAIVNDALSDYASQKGEVRFGNDILEFLRPLIYYSQIHTVRGVQPVDMITHEEAWRKAQQWMNDNYDIVESEGGSYRVPKQSPSSAPESGGEQEGFKWTDDLVKKLIYRKCSFSQEYFTNVQKMLDEFKADFVPNTPPTKESGGDEEVNSHTDGEWKEDYSDYYKVKVKKQANEIERLKGLIEKAFYYNEPQLNSSWRQFQKENGLTDK